MRKTLALAAAAALIATSVTAPAPFAKPAHPNRQCFYARDVNGFAAPDDRNLYVRVGVRDVYHFAMFGPCPDIDWNERLALISRGSSWICSGLDAEVVTHTPIGPQRCMVRDLRKLSPQEVAALPKRARP